MATLGRQANYLLYVYSIVGRKHDSICRKFGDIEGAKLVHTAATSGSSNGSSQVRHKVRLRFDDRYVQVIACCFKPMPHFMNHSGWRAVADQSRLDVFNGWETEPGLVWKDDVVPLLYPVLSLGSLLFPRLSMLQFQGKPQQSHHPNNPCCFRRRRSVGVDTVVLQTIPFLDSMFVIWLYGSVRPTWQHVCPLERW